MTVVKSVSDGLSDVAQADYLGVDLHLDSYLGVDLHLGLQCFIENVTRNVTSRRHVLGALV